MAEETPIRIGILGCARIAYKLSRAVRLAPNAELGAVGSRSLEKAKAFAAANGFPPHAKIYGSYDALLDDPDIDAVYIPVPTSARLHWAILAAKKKKHIILEKPVALDVSQFDKILDAVESSGVQLMDATMWMHHPRTQAVKDFLSDADRFGQLKTVHSHFSFAGDSDFLKNDIRVKADLDGLGALGDAGWYCIRGILLAANFELPRTVTALPKAVLNEAGVILACGASLHWEDGKSATFHCSFLSNMTMDISAVGTKGTLHVHDFIIPFQEKEAYFSTGTESWFKDLLTGWLAEPTKHVIPADLPQEVRMVREFANLIGAIKNGSKPETKWPTISRKTQLVLDAVKASIDQGYKEVAVVY